MPCFDYLGNQIHIGGGTPSIDATDAQCTAAFMSYVAERVQDWGMTDTVFANPHGLTVVSTSSPRDLLKLGLVVCGTPWSTRIWGQASRRFPVGGSHARTLEIANANLAAAATYQWIGGKGGSLVPSGTSGSDTYRRARIATFDTIYGPVLVSAMGHGRNTYDNISQIMQEIVGMLVTQAGGGTPTEGTYVSDLISSGGGYAGMYMPAAPQCYNLLTPAQIVARAGTLAHNADVVRTPASTTKTATMVCALEIIEDLQAVETLKAVDITSGSGSTYYAGDSLRLLDALQIMMMESSNTLASFLGRVCGRMLLERSV